MIMNDAVVNIHMYSWCGWMFNLSLVNPFYLFLWLCLVLVVALIAYGE